MKFFRHNTSNVRIIHNSEEFSCTPEQFQALEPDYPGLPDGATLRYQTLEQQYILGAGGQKQPDTIDALPYCDRIPLYTVPEPAFYAHVALSKHVLSIDNDSLTFSAALRLGPAADALLLPMTTAWPIMIRQKNGLAFDNIMIAFIDGQCAYTYTYKDGLPLGEWYIDEQDFSLVEYEGQTYRVKLAAPVHFTIYRMLQNA